MNTYTKIVLLALTLTSIGALVTASGLERKNDTTMEKILAVLQNLKLTGIAEILQKVEQALTRMDEANKDKLLDWLLNLAPTGCKVSLPKHTNTICKLKRSLELQIMKVTWTLTESEFGFMVLDTTPQQHVLKTFLDPFSRFNLEGYLQTILTNKLSYPFYNFLFNSASENKNYRILSMYFGMASTHGGQFALRPSQYEAFVHEQHKWICDKFFTQQRLAGVNPMSLRRVTNSSKASIGLYWKKLKELLNPEFDWKAAVQKALEHDYSLEEAIDQDRLYALRYEFMDNLPREPDLTDNDPQRQMWNTYSPIALFASKQDTNGKSRNILVPVAIQMDYTPDSAVYTPRDAGNWMLAKLNLQITDLGYAQIVEHLGKVHLMMEPFCVILKRALASEHPLHQILKYHCRDILTPNSVGTPALLDDMKFVDQLFAFGNKGAARILKNGYQIAKWAVTDFRGEIKRRGLDNKKLLPYFPYRDDGEQILEVIENMVKEYVDLYYHRNEDVKTDNELQDYLNELSAKGQLRYGGRYGSLYGKIKGLPASIGTKQELCDIVTRIISQLTIQHAAVNYPLSDYAAYIPNLPTKLYNDTRVKEGTFNYSRLPNGKTSSIQASFSNTLALYRFDTLFDYGNDLKDNNAAELLNRYFNNLTTIVQPEMQKKNQERKKDGYLTYPYFIPRWLPNGVQT